MAPFSARREGNDDDDNKSSEREKNKEEKLTRAIKKPAKDRLLIFYEIFATVKAKVR